MKHVYRIVSSMRFGLSLMGVCAAVLAAGTVIMPDNITETLLFRLLFLCVLLNMGACTVNQIVVYIKRRTHEDRSKNIRRLALIALHGGIVLVLSGGVMGFLGSFRTGVLVKAGEKTDIGELSSEKVPMELTILDFKIAYSQENTVSQYYVDMQMSGKGAWEGSEARFVVSVNSPAAFHSAKVYYSDYFNRYTVKTLTSDGILRQTECWDGEYAHLPIEAEKSLRIVKSLPTDAEKDDAPRIFHAIEYNDEVQITDGLPDTWYELESGIYYQFTDIQPHIVLLVKNSEGIALVAAGALLIVLGTLAVFGRKEKQA